MVLMNLFAGIEWRHRCRGAQLAKNLPAMQETQVWFLGWEDPLEKEMATHSSILAWRISWSLLGWSRVLEESDTTWWLNHDQVLKVFSINWRGIALQCWVNFCCTTVWISHSYMYCLPPPIAEHQVGFPLLHSSFLLASCFAWHRVCLWVLLSQFMPVLLLPLCLQSALYVDLWWFAG